MIDLHDERDLVRIAACHGRQHAERRCDAVAAAFDGELDDVLRIEIHRVGRERCAAGMFHALIHRQYRKVAGVRQSPMSVQRLQAAQHAGLAVFHRDHAIHVIRTRQVQRFFRDASTTVFQQMVCFFAQQLHDVRHDFAPWMVRMALPSYSLCIILCIPTLLPENP